MKWLFKNALRRIGFDVVRFPPKTNSEMDAVRDLPDDRKEIVLAAKPFTMTGVERIASLIEAVDYVTEMQIPGDIVECGVWRGGSMMAIALTLLARGDRSRSLYLYDTFEGMSSPTAADKSQEGPAEEQLRRDKKGTGIWCYASLEDVRANLLSTGYPEEKIHLIKGKVEDTIPATLPSHLAMLRLDTDWYESTRHELTHLYPRLHPKGVLILDDYGHWEGARKAVDEYFGERKSKLFFHRIDYSARILVGSGQ